MTIYNKYENLEEKVEKFSVAIFNIHIFHIWFSNLGVCCTKHNTVAQQYFFFKSDGFCMINTTHRASF